MLISLSFHGSLVPEPVEGKFMRLRPKGLKEFPYVEKHASNKNKLLKKSVYGQSQYAKKVRYEVLEISTKCRNGVPVYLQLFFAFCMHWNTQFDIKQYLINVLKN